MYGENDRQTDRQTDRTNFTFMWGSLRLAPISYNTGTRASPDIHIHTCPQALYIYIRQSTLAYGKTLITYGHMIMNGYKEIGIAHEIA